MYPSINYTTVYNTTVIVHNLNTNSVIKATTQIYLLLSFDTSLYNTIINKHNLIYFIGIKYAIKREELRKFDSFIIPFFLIDYIPIKEKVAYYNLNRSIIIVIVIVPKS